MCSVQCARWNVAHAAAAAVCVCVCVGGEGGEVSSGVLHQIDAWHCLPSARTFAGGIPPLLQPGAMYSGIIALRITFAGGKSTLYGIIKGRSTSRVDEGRGVKT